uniref:BHLH domain-containing protein n=1 Tax=Angiostrongylus cantonensis TaxID=6313 RepID=A0A0K0DCH3_ANGCA
MQLPFSGPFRYSCIDCDGQVKREKRKYRCRKRSPATIERARAVRRDKERNNKTVQTTRVQANARERRRMNNLNDALEHLRMLLPSVPDEPKMTKIETLRVAQGYITFLSSILADADGYRPPLEITPYMSSAYPSVWPAKNKQ